MFVDAYPSWIDTFVDKNHAGVAVVSPNRCA